MKVVVSPAAEVALRTLDPEDRQRVRTWFGSFESWETDVFVQERSVRLAERLPNGEYVYYFRTSSDIRIFFAVGQETITVLDVTRKKAIDVFRGISLQPGVP